jgi:thymidylate synthase (FAD)
MKIIKPYVEFITAINKEDIYKKIELCGRVCYKTEDKITEDSATKFVSMIMKRGHEAVIEHESITVKVVCDRGVSHEIVRHRLASYCQESTRYCNYSNDRFGSELTFIEPCFWNNHGQVLSLTAWKETMKTIEINYLLMLGNGSTPQEARSILPNSLKTEIIMTMNLREWRHFFRLRCSETAHPQMREVALMIQKEFVEKLPEIFNV